jgi:hypothetical protein
MTEERQGRQRQQGKDIAKDNGKVLRLLEVVDAVVFGLRNAEEGAVAEFGGEGDLVCGVGPGLEV